MYWVVLLSISALTSARPSPDPDARDIPPLQYTVKSFNYKLPQIPMAEERATNDALFFVRFPQYSVNVHHYCPYQLVKSTYMTERVGDPDHCVNKADLAYWSEEKNQEIVLDSYDIIRESLADRKYVNSITVYKATEVNTHHVTLSLADHTCMRMEYVVGDDLSITKSAQVMECKEVYQLNRENDLWVKEHLAKAMETAMKEAQHLQT